MQIHVHCESWKLRNPFRITGKTFETTDVIVVELRDGDFIGRGEASGVYYLNETATSMMQQIASVTQQIERGITLGLLQILLPPGGARNALDCALWDLETKRTGKSIWQLLSISQRPVTTPYTVVIGESSEAMAASAAQAASPVIKIKLDHVTPVERVRAIRAARPDATLVIDANQGWSFAQLQACAPEMAALGVAMIEQPLPRGQDEALEGYRSPLPLCADESCLHLGEIDAAARRYQMINIKLDKCGGLSEALRMVDAARAKGLDVMVGCMLGTSLAMAPAYVIAQHCTFADIDAPIFLTFDRPRGLRYVKGLVDPPSRALWG